MMPRTSPVSSPAPPLDPSLKNEAITRARGRVVEPAPLGEALVDGHLHEQEREPPGLLRRSRKLPLEVPALELVAPNDLRARSSCPFLRVRLASVFETPESEPSPPAPKL